MSPEQWVRLAVYGSFLGGLAAIIVFLVQLLAWPDDRQKASAMAMVISSGIFIWRIWLAIAFDISMRDNPSALLYVLMMAGWIWFMVETIALNWGRFRHRLRNWRLHPIVAWCCRRRRS